MGVDSVRFRVYEIFGVDLLHEFELGFWKATFCDFPMPSVVIRSQYLMPGMLPSQKQVRSAPTASDTALCPLFDEIPFVPSVELFKT